MAQVQIGLAGIFSRFLFAFAIVALTWNPTRFNFLAWALVQWHAMAPLVEGRFASAFVRATKPVPTTVADTAAKSCCGPTCC